MAASVSAVDLTVHQPSISTYAMIASSEASILLIRDDEFVLSFTLYDTSFRLHAYMCEIDLPL